MSAEAYPHILLDMAARAVDVHKRRIQQPGSNEDIIGHHADLLRTAGQQQSQLHIGGASVQHNGLSVLHQFFGFPGDALFLGLISAGFFGNRDFLHQPFLYHCSAKGTGNAVVILQVFQIPADGRGRDLELLGQRLNCDAAVFLKVFDYFFSSLYWKHGFPHYPVTLEPVILFNYDYLCFLLFIITHFQGVVNSKRTYLIIFKHFQTHLNAK